MMVNMIMMIVIGEYKIMDSSKLRKSTIVEIKINPVDKVKKSTVCSLLSIVTHACMGMGTW